MSFDNHDDDLALKSPKIAVNYDFEKSTTTRIQIQYCFGITATYPFLFCTVTSQTIHSSKDVIPTNRTATDSL